MYFKGMIEEYPLQAYASALLFSPTSSLVRWLFQHEKPRDIVVKPTMSESWTACLQTLEEHGGLVHSVAFSPDRIHVVTKNSNFCLNVSIISTTSNTNLNSIYNKARYIGLNNS